jgi:hypothetical protein
MNEKKKQKKEKEDEENRIIFLYNNLLLTKTELEHNNYNVNNGEVTQMI